MASCPSLAARAGHVHSSPATPRNMPIPRQPPQRTCSFFRSMRDVLILGLEQRTLGHRAHHWRPGLDMSTLRQPPQRTCSFLASGNGHQGIVPITGGQGGTCPLFASHPTEHAHFSPATPWDMLILPWHAGHAHSWPRATDIMASCPSLAVRAGHVPRWRGPSRGGLRPAAAPHRARGRSSPDRARTCPGTSRRRPQGLAAVPVWPIRRR
ncbi:hypothetical protein ABH915_001063 [Arthrobacter sp. MW3 TE3886]